LNNTLATTIGAIIFLVTVTTFIVVFTVILNWVHPINGALPELTQKYLLIAPNGTQYTCDIDLNGTFIGCSPNLVIRTNSSIDGKKELDDFLKNIIPKLDFIPLQGA